MLLYYIFAFIHKVIGLFLLLTMKKSMILFSIYVNFGSWMIRSNTNTDIYLTKVWKLIYFTIFQLFTWSVRKTIKWICEYYIYYIKRPLEKMISSFSFIQFIVFLSLQVIEMLHLHKPESKTKFDRKKSRISTQ